MSHNVEGSSPDNIHSMSDYKVELVNGKYVKDLNTDFEDTALDGTLEKGKGALKEKEERKIEFPPVGFFSLFRYSSSWDKVLIIIGAVFAIATGAAGPGATILYGKLVDQLINFDLTLKNRTNETMTRDEFLHGTAQLCIINVGLGCAFLVSNYIMVSFFSMAAASQAFRIKNLFMRSILKQDIGWYDTTETGDFASRITGDLSKIHEGLGEKVCICISYISTVLFCIGAALLLSWKLTLFTLSFTPVITFSVAFMSKLQTNASRDEMQAYGVAGAVAEEVFSAIRTIVAYGGEKKEILRYQKCLVPARKKGIKRGLLTALTQCITWIFSFVSFAMAFWYGVKLVANGSITGGELITVMFTVRHATRYFEQTAPFLEALSVAKGAAAKIYDVIERVPSIDSSSDEGKKPDSVKGTIKIRDIHFKYPSRPTVTILKGVSLDVQPGERVALVGPSGCGKSTIIQLLLRFYDTAQGAVILDENNVKDLNVGWLRDQIGLVGQEPVLFAMTIAENIGYGKKDATQEEIENAAKTANVHDFIQALPLQYETIIGERGTQLSGGQKQRIAIARALVKNPRILLLDEVTSALDTESESVVQAALDEASQGRTTIVVAHRLSTIRTADKIVVLSEGNIREVGTHEELMRKEGIYFNLVQKQEKSSKREKEDEELGKSDTYLVKELGRKISAMRTGYSVGDAIGLKGAVQMQTASSSWAQVNSVDAIEEGIEERPAEKKSPSQARLWKVAVRDWPYVLVGGIAATLMGLHLTAMAFLLGTVIGAMSKEHDEMVKEAYFFCIVFLVMAATSGLSSFLQVFMFTLAGEKLTSRLRKMVFSNIITQDMEFFDNPQNSVGSLCSRMTSDASSVQGATGSIVSTLFQTASSLIATLVLAFWFEYKIGLLVVALLPVVIQGAYFESREAKGQDSRNKQGEEQALKVAVEAIESIRTVASLHQEETFFLKFQEHLIGPYKKSKKESHVRGIVFGFAQGFFAGFAEAAIMLYGSRLVANQELEFGNLMKVLESFLECGMVLGQVVAFAPDYRKAKLAAVRIFQLLDIKPKINQFSESGKKLEDVKGHIQFKRVNFSYSRRDNVKILRDLTLRIKPGQSVALVGSSGCGKSTCMQLIERFYEPQSGCVLLDDNEVKEMNVSNLRSHVGLVSQEPVLLSCSIAENIAYGDNSRQVGMHEIMEAARKANIHNFISELPQGYETPVGDKGAQLSGGQKQRVAIARALLRNPKILLLDEATSALDAESEQIVQDALDKARSGRTCLVIAHRLTTVQNADVIMVMHEGRIVEQGTHQELLNKGGHYYSLHNNQSCAQ